MQALRLMWIQANNGNRHGQLETGELLAGLCGQLPGDAAGIGHEAGIAGIAPPGRAANPQAQAPCLGVRRERYDAPGWRGSDAIPPGTPRGPAGHRLASGPVEAITAHAFEGQGREGRLETGIGPNSGVRDHKGHYRQEVVVAHYVPIRQSQFIVAESDPDLG